MTFPTMSILEPARPSMLYECSLISSRVVVPNHALCAPNASGVGNTACVSASLRCSGLYHMVTVSVH